MARRIEVDPEKRREHRTLAAAVGAASPGDEIHVAPGIYAESVVLDRPVHLMAAPGTVTIEARDAFTLHLLPAAAGSTVSGLHLLGQDSHSTVKIEAPASRLVDCVVEASKVEGLWAVDAGQVDLKRCQLSSALTAAVNIRGALAVLRSCDLSAPGGAGLAVNSAQISVDGCSFAGIGTNALYLESGVRGTVQRCTFSDGRSPDYPAIGWEPRATSPFSPASSTASAPTPSSTVPALGGASRAARSVRSAARA
ncbi:MAG: right-handed parallel beta-helix repeat-containing protein [Acidimicrobiales bacterium]